MDTATIVQHASEFSYWKQNNYMNLSNQIIFFIISFEKNKGGSNYACQVYSITKP